jgi:signal transduction histidine kinase
VLVCDDSTTMRALMRSILGPRYVLLLTSTGEEALERGPAFAPDDTEVKDRLMRGLAESNAIAADLADASQRIERITQDLRVFASPALGLEELVDAGEAVDAAWTAARGKVVPRPALVREVEPGEPLLATRALVIQPIAVVLEHALLFAGPQGHVSVRVRQIGGGVEVAVRSSGAGIPREELPRLFDPLHARRTGAGPGLAVAYGIVHGLGGDLSVESPPGEGATFRLRFPRRPGAFARGGYPISPPRPGAPRRGARAPPPPRSARPAR